MTQEDKELLLTDLCARLPYNVKVDITYSKEHGSSDRLRICSEGCLMLNTDVLGLYIEDEIYLKPYLRPMSSMTEEEKSELRQWGCLCMTPDNCVEDVGVYGAIHSIPVICWLISHHFDCFGFIKKDLALRAPDGMYNN